MAGSIRVRPLANILILIFHATFWPRLWICCGLGRIVPTQINGRQKQKGTWQEDNLFEKYHTFSYYSAHAHTICTLYIHAHSHITAVHVCFNNYKLIIRLIDFNSARDKQDVLTKSLKLKTFLSRGQNRNAHRCRHHCLHTKHEFLCSLSTSRCTPDAARWTLLNVLTAAHTVQGFRHSRVCTLKAKRATSDENWTGGRLGRSPGRASEPSAVAWVQVQPLCCMPSPLSPAYL